MMLRYRNLVLLLFSLAIHAQTYAGRLLLVGGGSEKTSASGWSTPAYRWAVEGKRVAVIGTSTGSLAPYLTQNCGAAFAREFAIDSHDSADSQVLYDTLLTYEAIFFRGGDQWEYYNLYRNTKLQDAVNIIYNNGGTICGTSAGMAILSTVVFTAQNGSAYPDDCIENPNNNDVKLADDFFHFADGYIFDTHFAERARFGRLTAFMANFKLNRGISLTGIGIDDMTCMAVDSAMLGTVYGTGCANIYTSDGSYTLNGTKLLADSVQVIQLLQGCTFDFNTHQVTMPALNRQLNTEMLSETGNYTVLASGSNKLNENATMLTDLVTNTGLTSDSVLILTANIALATTFKDKILQAGAAGAEIFLINSDAGTDINLFQSIKSARKILFTGNNEQALIQFLGTDNGLALNDKVHRSGMVTAFAGDDSRFAGKTVVGNFYELYASYYAELTFNKGLALLRNTVIMPNTFYDSDMYENSATAVPYAMALDTLKFGIWLTNHNYMKFQPLDGKTVLTGYGAAPVMLVRIAGSLAGFSTQTGTGSSSAARMIAGFEKLDFSLIDYTTPYVMGSVNTAAVNTVVANDFFQISPNPVNDVLQLNVTKGSFSWQIINQNGQIVKNGVSSRITEAVNTSDLLPGVYFIQVFSTSLPKPETRKFIKQ